MPCECEGTKFQLHFLCADQLRSKVTVLLYVLIYARRTQRAPILNAALSDSTSILDTTLTVLILQGAYTWFVVDFRAPTSQFMVNLVCVVFSIVLTRDTDTRRSSEFPVSSPEHEHRYRDELMHFYSRCITGSV